MKHESKKIGILGGGQLAMMLAQSAIQLGYQVLVLDPTPLCPATKVGAKQIVASFKDPEQIKHFSKMVDVLTIDIEDVSIPDDLHCPLYPNQKTISTIRNKWLQKQHFIKNGIPTSQFAEYKEEEDHSTHVLKIRCGGYDGRGVWLDPTDFSNVVLKSEDFFVEEKINIKKELAILVACGIRDKEIYPITEIIQEDGICVKTKCPIPLDLEIREKVNEIALHAVSSFNTKGVFAVELFLTEDDQVLVNEISPRVHNSGHYTIEGSITNQFEQHILCITDQQLGDASLKVSYVEMENILGGRTYDNEGTFHWYHKSEERNRRKMGHLTFVNGKTDYPLVYVVMGSSSDLLHMRGCIEILEEYGIPHKVDIVSAHRSPDWMFKFGKNVESWCGEVVIAAAGGAAHLPGMLASLTALPVIGVPIPSKSLSGIDSLYSIVEMPDGVPVATVGIGKSKNAGILALKILGFNNISKDVMKKNGEKVEMQRKTLRKDKKDKIIV
jgi:phosphoribosylaminoimidazole carboxylase